MKNNFKKNGNMRIRFETPEERWEILRILEEERGFLIDAEEKKVTEIHPMSSRTFDINLRYKTIRYGVQPFIGAAMMSNGVRFYSAREFFRIAELKFRKVPRFPIFHVPHDGWQFPEELMASVCVPDEDFRRYHEQMRDAAVMRMIPEAYRGGDMCWPFRVSRLLCDVERFTGPEEVMEQYGMGFCYEKAYDGTVIKRVTDELKALTRKYYDEHHAWLDTACGRHPRVLLFDMHSFSDRIVPKDFLRDGVPTPDVCIGTDGRYTPPELTAVVERRFAEAGYSAAVNDPYSGCFVPNAVMNGTCGTDFIGIMLEVNRRAYCDEAGEPVPEKLAAVREVVQRIIVDCVDLD